MRYLDPYDILLVKLVHTGHFRYCSLSTPPTASQASAAGVDGVTQTLPY